MGRKKKADAAAPEDPSVDHTVAVAEAPAEKKPRAKRKSKVEAGPKPEQTEAAKDSAEVDTDVEAEWPAPAEPSATPTRKPFAGFADDAADPWAGFTETGMRPYESFIESKSHTANGFGFEPIFVPDYLFDFQSFLLDWNLRQGRSATFADCGMGKTPLALAYAENIVRKTNKPVLLLTWLAVAAQFVEEGEKFNIEVRRSNGPIYKGIVVTNYQQLHRFNPNDFAAVICDESSILKNCKGVIRAAVNEFMRRAPYRLLLTATAAPNDWPELGTSSEALGYMGHMDMLSKFFKNDRSTIDTRGHWRGHAAPRVYEGPKWRFRGHAEEPFWRWVCSWARAIRKPSDFGFEDGPFVLPPLIEREHEVKARAPRPGLLFAMPAVGLREEREERRRTLAERCEMTAAIVTAKPDVASVSWCHLNDEGDLLERLIPGAVQVSGKDSDEEKVEKLTAFSRGQFKKLVTKDVIAAYGLNWQHCAHQTHFASHSYERQYQSIRRSLRFGQKNPVEIDYILSDGEGRVLANLRRKAEQSSEMFDRIVRYMRQAMGINRREFTERVEVPAWLL